MTPEELRHKLLDAGVPDDGTIGWVFSIFWEAIEAAQAEQRRKDAEIARGMTGARPREIADAIKTQEETP